MAMINDVYHLFSLRDVLLEGGTVVDAGIATLLCMGVIQTQSMGVGGGFLMVLYNATTRTSVVSGPY